MLKWYRLQLSRRPYLTQSITSAILFGTGDCLAQELVEGVDGRRGYDYARTLRMGIYGGGLFGPAATAWFSFLQRRVVVPRRPWLQTGARVLLDQTVFAPMSLAVFLSYMAALDSAAAPASPSDHRAAKEVNAPVGKTDRGAGAEGGGGGAEKEPVKNDGTVIGNVRERMSTVFWPILARGYTVWPVVQTLNFALVPPHHRVLVVNTIALGWNCYLSYASNAGAHA